MKLNFKLQPMKNELSWMQTSFARVAMAVLTLVVLSNVVNADTTISSSTPGNWSWTCPAGVSSITVECWGGGGGGGGVGVNYAAAGGGAGGSYVKYTVNVSAGTTYNLTVGAGGTAGAGGTVTGANGGTGGSSYFGNTTIGNSSGASVLAVGGNGGNLNNTAGTSANRSGGAAGGTAQSTGNLPSSGATTSNYGTVGTNSVGGASGTAKSGGGANGAGSSGNTGGGAGGPGSTSASNGANGTAPGGGGAGGYQVTATSNGTGGTGGAGQISITIPGNFSFASGDLTVLQADTASANNTTFTIIDLNPSASLASSISISGTGSSALRVSGSASSTGYMADSDDGTLLAFTGANTNDTGANVNTYLVRGVGTLNNSGTFTLQTTYTGTSGQQTRGACSVNNSAWYIGDQGGIYTNGVTSAIKGGNFRAVKSFGGTLYIGSSSVAPVQTISGGTTNTLSGLTTVDGNLQDFYLISSGNNGSTYDVLYILDDTTATAGTINKYSLVSGTWTANGSYSTSFGGFGLCAAKSGNQEVLYVTTGTGATAGNSVIKLTDTAGYNSTINITTGNNVTLYTDSSTATLKGIAFAPVSYTVTYNGNNNTGGSVPTDSTAYANGATVTAKSNSGGLTRTGYAFAGWNTAADGSGTTYAAGTGTFTISVNTTLYAKWLPTYTVTYDGNGNTGGSVPTDSGNYTNGATVTVLGNTGNLTQTGYGFAGWNTASDGSGTPYAATGSATFIMGSANVILYAQWTQTPSITTIGGPLNFGPVAVNGTSASQSYNVSGANLTDPNGITINAPANFQVSTDNSAFSSQVILPQSGGTVSSTPIYVRFQPTQLQSYSDNITNTSSGASSQYVAVSGTGASAPSVTTQAASPTTNSATLNGTVTTANGAAITDRGFYWSASPGVTTSGNQLDEGGTTTGAFSKAIPVGTLSPNTIYYYRAYAVNSIGTTLDSSGDTSFYTLANTPTAPTVGNPTTNTLNVTIGSGDGNPPATTYAIQETSTLKYVQADGTLAASPVVYQTASTWGTVTVTGLSSGTIYTFQVAATNTAGTQTAFSPTATASTAALAFTTGDLAIILAANTNLANTTFSILELNSSTASQSSPVQTIAINGISGGSALRISGSATSAPYLADSDDGTLLAFTGANSTDALSAVNTIAARGVGTLNNAGTFSLAATYTGVTTGGTQSRGATSVNNSTWFIGDQGGIYSNGSTTPSPSGNFRAVKSFGGTVYVLQTTSGTIVVNTLSAATGGTLTGLPGLARDANASDFYLISSGNNGSVFDVLYTIGTDAIKKYSLVNGSWTANGTYTTQTGFGLCVAKSGGGSVLYVTTGNGALGANSVIKLTDSAGYNANISINTPDNVTLYTATLPTGMKGIAFAPGSPTITGAATASAFTTTYGTASIPQSFAVSGAYLSANLVATAPTGFEVSSDGTTYGSTATFTMNSGVASGTLYLRLAATAPVSGSYDSQNIVLSTTGATSVNISTASSGNTVNPATLTYTADSASMTYGGTVPTLSGNVTGFVNDENQAGATTGTLSFTTSATSSSPAGSYAINGGGLSAANYTFAQDPGNATALTINKATPILQAATTASVITYGQALSGSMLSGGSFTNAAGTAVSGGFAFTAPSTKPNAGTADQSVTFTPADTANYNIPASFNVSVTVNPLAVTLTGSRVYDGTNAAAAEILTVANNLDGGNLTLSGSVTLASQNVGSQNITSFDGLTLGGTAAGNYTLTGASGSVTITSAPLSITANPVSKTYGTALTLDSTAFTVGPGLVSPETVTAVTMTASGGTAATDPVSGSPYTITPSAATGTTGFLAANYNISYITNSLTVNPLPVVLTGTRPYDGTTAAAFGILSVANQVGSDDVYVASGSATLASASVGTNAITSFVSLTLGGTTASNYTLAGASGAVMVTNPHTPFSIATPYIDDTGTNLVLIWNSIPGVTYQVRGSTDLNIWTNVGDPINATDTQTTNTVPIYSFPAQSFFDIFVD